MLKRNLKNWRKFDNLKKVLNLLKTPKKLKNQKIQFKRINWFEIQVFYLTFLIKKKTLKTQKNLLLKIKNKNKDEKQNKN